jgi:rare lipoprotein A
VVKPPATRLDQPRKIEVGHASWYGAKFHGKKTASGLIFDQSEFTAAHRNLPLGSRVRVTNLENDRFVEVQVNDRGPFVPGRIIDLSRAAARALGMLEDGVTRVRVELLALP